MPFNLLSVYHFDRICSGTKVDDYDKLSYKENSERSPTMDLSQITANLQIISSFLVTVTALLTAIIGLIKPVRKWFINQFRAYSNKETNERIDKIEVNVDKISTFIDNVGEKLTAKFARDAAEQQLTKEAIKAILRNQMLASYNRSEERGYIGDWDRDNFEQLFNIYTELGGNSYMHTVHEKVLLMPRVPKVKKKTKKK